MSTIIAERRSRATGTVVQVVDNRDGEFDANAEENPWYTVCVDHGGVCSHLTRRLAILFAPVPNEWCPVCQGTEPCGCSGYAESCAKCGHSSGQPGDGCGCSLGG